MENKSVETEEYKKLKEKYNSTVKGYVELVNEREKFCYKEKTYLEAKYFSTFGFILKKKLQLEIELKRIKKKIELIQFYANCNEKLDMDSVEIRLQKEMKEFNENLSDFINRVNQSRVLLSDTELTSEENDELEKIFKAAAERLHPDINKNITEKGTELWSKVLSAYETNNLAELRVIESAVNKNKKSKIAASSEELKRDIDVLNNKINITYNSIENMKKEFPFNIKQKLDDVQWINNQKSNFKNSAIELDKNIKRYNDFLEAFEAEFIEE